MRLIPAETSSLVVRPPHPEVAPDDLFDSENLVIITPTKRAHNDRIEDGHFLKWSAVPAIEYVANALAGPVRDEVLERPHHGTRSVECGRQSRVPRNAAYIRRGRRRKLYVRIHVKELERLARDRAWTLREILR